MIKIYGLFIGTLILAGCVQQPERTKPIAPEVPTVVDEEVQELETIAFKVKLTEFSTGNPLANQTFELQSAKGELLGTGTTNAQGMASFEDVALGQEVNVLLESPVMKISRHFIVDNENDELLIETYAQNKAISVPILLQEPELPTGCEMTSLTAMLNYYGEPVTKEEMAKKFLKKVPLRIEGGKLIGPDPQDAFTGDPTSAKGVYVFPQAVVETAEKYATSVNEQFAASDLSGSSSQEIEKYITSGVPVLMWITRELEPPVTNNGWWIEGTMEYHKTFQNQHAVVLTGIDESSVTIMDPLKGKVVHDKSEFFTSYESLGSYAMTLYKES
ncbi:C39 family peptidase [Planococcus sp. N064]|uniref:C39 family peptidase n=1 Tax=Planococcus liqunii TaxID=3058394 RepID=A0ABT8MU76_9BACL|nr:C39 family peptidase [Planococcus sp. N064]MDN7228455.1 C39 family peptidase [Planococcus sp. N064]